MQNLKPKFEQKTKERLSTVQSCIRTNDIDLWGDGSHFCFFRMIGCFSFGNPEDYLKTCDAWLAIVEELGIKITSVHVHPDSGHRTIFEGKGDYQIVDDLECLWSDGKVGGYCSEFYVGGLEIGNLVNPMGDSVDVGFGLERMYRVLGENYDSLYDLEQFLEHCWKNKIEPGNKERNHTVRKILRLWLRQPDSNGKNTVFNEWVLSEKKKLDSSMRNGYGMLRKHWNKSNECWYNSVGLLPEEVEILKKNRLEKKKL